MKSFFKVTFAFFLIISSGRCFDPGNLHGANLWSKNDRTHADLTECSLYKITYDWLLTSKYSSVIDFSQFGKVVIDRGKCNGASKLIERILETLSLSWMNYQKAVELISTSNRWVDIYDATEEEAHFDGESFSKGANRISSLKYAALEAVNKENYVSARKYVGELLHTIQDFYSHSNWVEFEPNVINLKLGKSLNLGDVADIAKRGCVNCATTECVSEIEKELIEKKILTSGYFKLIPFFGKKPLGKCSHGGIFDQSKGQNAVGGGINKDTLTSIHGNLHLDAANLAQLSTYEFLKDFWSLVNDTNFGNFLGFRGQSLVIVIDTTGSMSPSIEAVKKTAIDLINNHQSSFNYILSPFNDPTWGPVSVNKDKNIFSEKINQLTASGGGDEPELYYHGLLDALKVCEPDSIVFTFTDAPAKDGYLRDEILSLALMKTIKINSIVVSSSGRNLKNQIDFIDESNQPASRSSILDYQDLAKTTGGINIFSSNQFIRNISNIILAQQEDQNNEYVLLMAETKNTYLNTFYVDSSITKLSFYISSSSQVPSFVILDPTNSSNAQNYTQLFDSKLTRYFSVDKPLVGTWKIQINTRDVFLKISCLSSTESLISLAMLNESLPHSGYLETGISPLANSNQSVFSFSSQEMNNVNIQVLTPDSIVIRELTLKLIDPFTASLYFIIPDRPFILKLNARLKSGTKFERYSSLIYIPTFFNIRFEIGQVKQVKIGEVFNFEISIENTGPISTTARVNLIDTFKLINYVKEVVIEASGTFTQNMSIKIPNNSSLNGLTNTITLSADSKNTYLMTNQKTIYLTIQSNEIRFDLEPKCIVLNDTRSLSCGSMSCSKNKLWHSLMLINETGSGLAQISSIQNLISNSSYFNLTYDKFNYSSKEPINVYLTADCCTQDIGVYVSDIYANVDKCEFKKMSFSSSLKFSRVQVFKNIFLVFIISFFLSLI